MSEQHNAITAADKAAAAHTELRTAEYRIVKLEGIEAERSKSILNLKNSLLFIADTDASSRKQLETLIADQSAELDAAKAERIGLKDSLTQLHMNAANYSHGEAIARSGRLVDELTAARAAWVDAITPLLAVAERLRVASMDAGAGHLLTDAELLSGVRKS
ncbi:hypothetical protein PQQ53_21380 [Paraburkholderia strydomiana]|uniref:hypothetical protein n=1 Tax=Paraburkholderia strydomiana TaxID=1245417 RepID=UPI0038B8CDBD